jgi:sugar lactone lactonase YvrE
MFRFAQNKSNMKKYIYLIAIILGAAMGCSKTTEPTPTEPVKTDPVKTDPVQNTAPTITAITPATLKTGEVLTITGTNFSTVATENVVTFTAASGGTTLTATIKTASATNLTADAPATAGTWAVSVKVKNVAATFATGVKAEVTVTATTTPPAGIAYTQVITFAGGVQPGFDDGIGTAATFYKCNGLLADAAGNIYVADAQLIRKITPAGVVSTVSGKVGGGNKDGGPGVAEFNAPTGMAFNAAGDIIIADLGNRRIRKLVIATGEVSTIAGSTSGFADGTGSAAKFENPNSVAIDADGNIFVADNNKIRKVTPAGVVTTFAGTSAEGDVIGDIRVAQFKGISYLTFDADGNLLVCDANNSKIKKITRAGVVSTFATGLSFPSGIVFDAEKNMYVPEAGFIGFKITKITPAGVKSVLAGSGTPGGADGALLAAQFYFPNAIAIAPSGVLYVAEGTNYRIRKIY